MVIVAIIIIMVIVAIILVDTPNAWAGKALRCSEHCAIELQLLHRTRHSLASASSPDVETFIYHSIVVH
jgi:hypothetical protein